MPSNQPLAAVSAQDGVLGILGRFYLALHDLPEGGLGFPAHRTRHEVAEPAHADDLVGIITEKLASLTVDQGHVALCVQRDYQCASDLQVALDFLFFPAQRYGGLTVLCEIFHKNDDVSDLPRSLVSASDCEAG